MMKELGQQWSSMTDSEKQPFFELSEKGKSRLHPLVSAAFPSASSTTKFKFDLDRLRYEEEVKVLSGK